MEWLAFCHCVLDDINGPYDILKHTSLLSISFVWCSGEDHLEFISDVDCTLNFELTKSSLFLKIALLRYS